MDQPSIYVACQGDQATVKVVGKGTFQNAAQLKNFAEAAIQDGTQTFLIDLEECPHMDSTFMGVLAGLARKQKERAAPVPKILHLNPRTRELLTNLGLDRILNITSPATTPDPGLQPLTETPPADKETTARTMLEAHRHLVAAHPDNAAKFQDVIKFLEARAAKPPS